MSGFNSPGGNSAPSARSPDNTVFLQVLNQLQELEQFVARDTQRLNQLSNQLFGPRPEKSLEGGISAVNSDVLSQITSLRRQCEAMRTAIDLFYNS